MDQGLQKNKSKLIRIAITGPESTGKSMLAEALASHYNTIWVPEYAREYIGQLNRPYDLNDILLIAKGQVQKEKVMETKADKILICDSELIVTKIWAEHAFGKCPVWILEHIEKIHYDLYLLCNIDMPWIPDPQREHPHLRSYFFDLYLQELKSRCLPFNIVSGTGKQRVKNALGFIQNIIRNPT